MVGRDPWIFNEFDGRVHRVQAALVRAARRLADTTPWLLADLPRRQPSSAYWPPYGLEPNLKMLTDFTQDQYARELVDTPVDPGPRSRITRALRGNPCTPLLREALR